MSEKISDGEVRELRHALRSQLSRQADYNTEAERRYVFTRSEVEQLVSVLDEALRRRRTDRAAEGYIARWLDVYRLARHAFVQAEEERVSAGEGETA